MQRAFEDGDVAEAFGQAGMGDGAVLPHRQQDHRQIRPRRLLCEEILELGDGGWRQRLFGDDQRADLGRREAGREIRHVLYRGARKPATLEDCRDDFRVASRGCQNGELLAHGGHQSFTRSPSRSPLLST
jgi:hypothetical protein